VAGRVSLIVKGPLKSAKRAAQRHGVALESCRAVGSRFGDLQCYAKCTTSANRNIVDWFSDRARAKAGRGHPPGTLLYHGSLCETDFGRKKTRKRRR
jgi:hypothetical protein